MVGGRCRNLPGLQACLGPACHLPSFVASFNRSAYPMSIVDTGSLRKGDQAADLALNSASGKVI